MEHKYIPVVTRKATARVYLNEIIYIEKRGRKTVLITENGSIDFYCEMAYIKKYTDGRFLDCHRSYLFNMDRIRTMTDQTIHMDLDFSVVLGREAFRRGRRIFSNYVSKGASQKEDGNLQ
ncbi:LytTR family transcriptional regulator [bacterium 210820-DFI.6.37]|nr:LytTR family transcriptional regulator [bacterium 210820-DFI.6.37]